MKGAEDCSLFLYRPFHSMPVLLLEAVAALWRHHVKFWGAMVFVAAFVRSIVVLLADNAMAR
jgi:hypothetical protein